MIGLDGYNFGENHNQWHSWVECRPVFEPALDKRREGESNWRLDADPESLAAWQRTFAAP